MDMEIRPHESGEERSDTEGEEAPLVERDAEQVEEIFIKELPEADSTPKKKQLSEAQIEGLRKGREKMKARRRQKIKDELARELEEEREKNAMVKEIKQKDLPPKLATARRRLMEKENATKKAKRSRFEKLKTQVLESMTSVKDFDHLADLLDEIDEEDIYDDEVLKTKLNTLFRKISPNKSLLGQ